MSSSIDGILGLWRGDIPGFSVIGEMVMPDITADSTITQNVFSFYMADLSIQSYIDFGEPNTAAMKDPNDLVYIDADTTKVHWTNTITGFRWASNMEDFKEYAIIAADAITDTGASCLIGPFSQLGYIVEQIKTKMGEIYTVSGTDFSEQFDCSLVPNLPKFELLWGGYWLEVLPEDYVITLSSTRCSLCF